MVEKSILTKIIESGANILQGRGGQSIIQDSIGNIFLTTQNKSGSNQQSLSVKDSISSIAILNGDTPPSIDISPKYSSNNFNTINYEQIPIGGVQVIQPIYNTTTSSNQSQVVPTPLQILRTTMDVLR